MNNYLKLGDYNAICDRCGFKFKASELRKTWEGFMVCQKDFETRHPQDLLRARKEDTSVPWTRPEQTDTFITVDYISTSIGNQETTIPSGTSGNGSTT